VTFQPGDRIRVVTEGDDGLPLVRYGWVGGVSSAAIGPVAVSVMLDSELGAQEFDLRHVELVTVTSLELTLRGLDLLQDSNLRRGLVGMWRAEAEQAGLDLDGLHPFGEGVLESTDRWALGEVQTGGNSYVLRATAAQHDSDVISVRADRPLAWGI
jgi:hypothetical protein